MKWERPFHELWQGDKIVFHEDHILAVHGSHREQIVLAIDAADLKTLTQLLENQGGVE